VNRQNGRSQLSRSSRNSYPGSLCNRPKVYISTFALFCPITIVVSTLRVSTTKNERDKGLFKILIQRYIFIHHSSPRALFNWRLQSNINYFELKNLAFGLHLSKWHTCIFCPKQSSFLRFAYPRLQMTRQTIFFFNFNPLNTESLPKIPFSTV